MLLSKEEIEHYNELAMTNLNHEGLSKCENCQR